ncbi:contact-dependent growth inhibition system immunity protein [Caenimonas sp. SL110]|uniref:contact-dependent growth inhibition system immunity protein n=1 Tax=Caenimonas sp. SL110 TaxID=1450524 RepID=UPI0006542237|nr:contact-dependent growth inhibition system immunity protein [Caenimonas sp. SL110]
MSTTFPNLEELIGGYFHQDWADDATSSVGVLDRYLSEWPLEDVPKVQAELAVVLQQSDEEIPRTLSALGNSFDPACEGVSYRQWLDQIRTRLAEFLRAKD